MFEWLFKKNNGNVNRLDGDTPQVPFVALIILDGLGITDFKKGNAVLQAKTPFLDTVWTNGFSTLIHASGIHVGLPDNYAGNSEVGHLNIGSGQVVYQSLPKINDAINNGKFYNLPAILQMIQEIKKRKAKFHIMGVLSNGGVHGHIEHLFALLDIAKQNGVEPYVHAFMDGRDTGPKDGFFFLSKLQEKLKEIGIGKIASITGRLYSLDRDHRWERTKAAYDAMTGNGARKSTDAMKSLQESYENGENDQTVTPTTIVDKGDRPIGAVGDNDVLFFYNFREDRARQITKAFVKKDFDSFKRENYPENLYFVTMTGYEEDLETNVVFPSHIIEDSLAKAVSEAGRKQMHISETEKYMHVTYFANGGREEPYPGEDRFNIPSPKSFDYLDTPEMSARIIGDEVQYRLKRPEKFDYGLYFINLANPDMLGHTGDVDVAAKAVEVTDEVTEIMVRDIVARGGAAILVADHGNCEQMRDPVTNATLTYHSTNPVPFIVVWDEKQLEKPAKEKLLKIGTGPNAVPTGILADVTPTTLAMLGIPSAPSMTGVNLMDVL